MNSIDVCDAHAVAETTSGSDVVVGVGCVGLDSGEIAASYRTICWWPRLIETHGNKLFADGRAAVR